MRDERRLVEGGLDECACTDADVDVDVNRCLGEDGEDIGQGGGATSWTAVGVEICDEVLSIDRS